MRDMDYVFFEIRFQKVMTLMREKKKRKLQFERFIYPVHSSVCA
jgi:hypothetical protein